MTPESQPMPGDVVRLTRDWNGVSAGKIAVLDGIVGESMPEYLAVFPYSVFRGRDFSGPEHISCSGGPCPYIAVDELRASGEMRRLTVWRWKDGWPRADNSEPYYIEVPVWDWDGPTRTGGEN